MTNAYGIVFDSLVEGPTGRDIQAKGKDATLVAYFLVKNHFDNMIGLYELPLVKMRRAFTVVRTITAVRRALAQLSEVGFAHFDEASEYVWVRELARVRLQLRGEPLAVDDKRRKGAVALYGHLPDNPFLGPFYDRYALELGLPTRRGGGEGASQGVSEGVSEGVPQGASETPSDSSKGSPQTPLPSTRNQETEIRDQVPESAAAAPQRSDGADGHDRQTQDAQPLASQNPDDNVEVITALVTKEILPLRLPDAELAEATKERCAVYGIAYNGQVVRKAIDSALFRYYREARLDGNLPADPRGLYHDHVPPGGRR